MNPIEIVYDYHERTKHHPNRYAASLGYMDWSTQPDPYRRYSGTRLIELPLIAADGPPSYQALFDDPRDISPLTLETLSQLIQYSMGLAAWKSIGSDSWALRCNASSGNLHPTEATLILPPIEGISEQSVIAHYAPKEHALELLASFETRFWDDLPVGTFFVGVSSVIWREAWKYGERAFRYTQLDAGHAQQAITLGAMLTNWRTRRIDDLPIDTLDRLLGLDQSERYIKDEREVSDMLLLISPEKLPTRDLERLIQDIPLRFDGKADRLSHGHHYWEAIGLIERATHMDPIASESIDPLQGPKCEIESDAKALILKRRSAQAMDPARTRISKTTFWRLLQSVQASMSHQQPTTDLVLFVHDVETLPKGLYLFLRSKAHLPQLKASTEEHFLWKELLSGLYLLEEGDFRSQAKSIACSQDIASDGAFSLGMLSEFESQLERFGAQRYKALYWECGAIGQQLYLEATSLGLSATGIGCFLDDVMHRLLGLTGRRFQVLYHFTIGRAIIDMRLKTHDAYAHLEREQIHLLNNN